jgi:hypothetical protein
MQASAPTTKGWWGIGCGTPQPMPHRPFVVGSARDQRPVSGHSALRVLMPWLLHLLKRCSSRRQSGPCGKGSETALATRRTVAATRQPGGGAEDRNFGERCFSLVGGRGGVGGRAGRVVGVGRLCWDHCGCCRIPPRWVEGFGSRGVSGKGKQHSSLAEA